MNEQTTSRTTFEFADRVYICDYCGSQQPDDDQPCPYCGWTLFTWAGFLGRADRFRVGSGDDPARASARPKETLRCAECRRPLPEGEIKCESCWAARPKETRP